MDPAIDVQGLRKSYGAFEAVRGISFEVARGEVFASSARTAPARRRRSRCSRATATPTPAPSACSASTRPPAARAYRARIGIVLQAAASTRHQRRARRPSCSRASTRDPRPVDEVLELVGPRREARRRVQHAVGRPAAPARRGARRRRQPGAALPRRADHRLRPRGPARRVGDDRRASRRAARRSCSPPTTWRRRRPSPTASR